MTSFGQHDFVPRRASEWLLALQASPGDEDLRAHHAAWLGESPAHVQDWEEINRTYALLGMIAPKVSDGPVSSTKPDQDDVSSGRKPMRPPSARRWHRGYLKARIAAAAAACLAVIAGPSILLHIRADHVSGTSHAETIRLADGSTVRLRPESAIAVDYRSDLRQVNLLKGEAFFEVARNSKRPFVVDAQGVKTTVLGTAFDVALNSHGVNVGVKRGLVRVEAAPAHPQSYQLHPGDSVRVSKGGAVRQDRRPPELIGGWTRGEIIARDMTVAEVVDAIRPWYAGLIVLRGESLAGQPTSGLYHLDDPVDALRALAEAQGASVRRISPWLLVISED